MVWYLPTTWFEDTGLQTRTSRYKVVQFFSEYGDKHKINYQAIAPFQEYFFGFPSNSLKYHSVGNGRTRTEAIENCRHNIKNNIPLKISL